MVDVLLFTVWRIDNKQVYKKREEIGVLTVCI